MLGFEDKRNFYRMMVNSPCQVGLLEQPSTQLMNAVCRDISATGMSIEVVSQIIDIGSLLEITIESNSEQIPSLIAKAKVVRCDEQQDNVSACVVAVEISEMN